MNEIPGGQPDTSEMLIYETPDRIVQTEVRLQSDTLWLTQSQLETLFDNDRTSVVKYIRNILETGELDKAATGAKFAPVRLECLRRVILEILHYFLGMILGFDGKEIYPSKKQKDAMILYLAAKNHSFVEGNKRIAAALLLHFLQQNDLLFLPDGSQRISNEGLVALKLLFAVSQPEGMNTMFDIVVTVLNGSHA